MPPGFFFKAVTVAERKSRVVSMNKARSYHCGTKVISGLSRACVAAIVCFVSLNAAFAEVHISGSKDAITVEAKNASLDDVVASLNSSFKANISVKPATHIRITGIYVGAIRQVVARMLSGHDFVLSSSNNQMKIILITEAGAVSRPAPAVVNGFNHAPVAVATTSEEENTSGTQGWPGGFTMGPPSH